MRDDPQKAVTPRHAKAREGAHMSSKSVIGLCLALTAIPSLALAQGGASPPATSGQSAPTPTKVAGGKAYNPEEVVCHYSAVTGTRFQTKSCHTRAEWDQLAQDSKDALNHATSITNRPGG
jgi:hypothetical protein